MAKHMVLTYLYFRILVSGFFVTGGELEVEIWENYYVNGGVSIQWPYQEPKLVQYLHFRILEFPL